MGRGTRRSGCCGVVLGLLLAAGLGGCADRGGDRVLVVGVDGATLRVIDPMIESGELPNLARLAREGVSGPLRSLKPMASPRIWNSVVTGKRPEKHGILNFVYTDDAGANHLYMSSDRKAHAIWNIVSDAGRRVGVVNFWNTYPPEKLDGVMVSDHVLASEKAVLQGWTKAGALPEAALAHPAPWIARVDRALQERVPMTDVPNPFADLAVLPRWLRGKPERLNRRYHEDGALVRVALEIIEQERPALMLVLLTGMDRIQHFIWGAMEPQELYPKSMRMRPAQQERSANALRQYYAYIDALIGRLLEHYGRDDLVLVVSDHGFEQGVDLGGLSGVHKGEAAADGILFARGRDVPAGRRVRMSVLDVTPTVLAWLGMPVAEDMDGRPADFLATARAGRIASYDTTPVERVPIESSGLEGEMVEELRGLGYIE